VNLTAKSRQIHWWSLWTKWQKINKLRK